MSVEAPAPPESEPAAPQGSRVGTLLAALARPLAFPLIAAAIAFAFGALVIVATGNNVVEAYGSLFSGGFGSRAALGRTLLNATPLVFTGLAVAVAFRAGLFNIGGEGQLFMGAIAASVVATIVPGPGWLAIVVALVAGGLAGFVWGAIPGLLRITGAHEVITTIMLNFVAINLTYYLAQVTFPAAVAEGSVGAIPGTEAVAEGTRIAQIGLGFTRAHYGIALAVGAAAVAYLLIWHTTRGFEIRAVGLAPDAARYAGISVAANAVLAIAIGGLFAGLGGAVQVLAVSPYRVVVPFTANLGFNGIGVALLGRNHPAGVVLGALFFGGLASGAQQMQFDAGVPLDLADVLLAVVLLLVTATRLAELVIGRRARALTVGTKLEKGLA